MLYCRLVLSLRILFCEVPFCVNGEELQVSSFVLSASDHQTKIWVHPHVLLMSGLKKWLNHIIRDRKAVGNEDKALELTHMELARGWYGEVEMARLLKNQGKWENWYLGDKKVNLHNSLKITEETLDQLKSWVK